MDFDADQAVKKVYLEYLASRFSRDDPNDRAEKLQRERLLDSGHPHQRDAVAIKAAHEAYVRAEGTGQALNAARDALWDQKNREEIRHREVDLSRYSKDAGYAERIDGLVEQRVKEQRADRYQQQASPERAEYERQAVQKDSASPREQATAREDWQKTVNGENRNQTVEQEQSLQQKREDRGR